LLVLLQVVVNTAFDEGEMEAIRRRCMELSHQVTNFHQQNEQLMYDLQETNNSKIQVQEENSRLYECNLELQRKLQSFLEDMNKTKYSIGALKDPSNAYQYGSSGGAAGQGTVEQERYSSVTAKTDIEILQEQSIALERQISQAEVLKSGEVQVSAVEEELKGKLQTEKEKSMKQTVQLTGQESQVK